MEEFILEAIKYIVAAIVGALFMLGIDAFTANDTNGDKERDKEDACNGILRGEAADNFMQQVEEVNKHFKKEAERELPISYIYEYDISRMGWCVFKGRPTAITWSYVSGPYRCMEEARDEARRLNKEAKGKG